MGTNVQGIVEKYGADKLRLMDILTDVQESDGCISDKAVAEIAAMLNISKVDVEQTMSFYHFFTSKNNGEYAVYLNTSAVSDMMGRKAIAAEFEKECGCKFGESTPDGKISLHYTACIGMNDQEPAAIINNQVFTKLSGSTVKQLVSQMKEGKPVGQMITSYGDGNNSHELVKSMVYNNIRQRGKVLFSEYEPGTALRKATEMSKTEVIEEVKNSNLRGRGGAGFPTGLKWDFCSRNQGEKYVICNADEGEPGTFKDRVILTELPKMMFEGMAVAGYAIGSNEGILYLRAEYKYLKAYLESVLNDMRNEGLLGKNIMGKFDFDIRIQFGAGAYVCGEESALIESVEGKRGEPRNKPPFPVQSGYKNKPTIINNVETFTAVSKIIDKGGMWYTEIGTAESAGTKLLSISGDCDYPGVYEIEWGMTINEMLKMAGASDVQAVQVAGPSGVCLNPDQFGRKIALEDLPTGGAMTIIGNKRNLLEIVHNYMEFFEDESCGSCNPCRALNKTLKHKVEKVMAGKATAKDLDEMIEWGRIIKNSTRCGLGQTSAHPVITSIENFPEVYKSKLVETDDNFMPFDLAEAVKDSCSYVGRTPKFHHN